VRRLHDADFHQLFRMFDGQRAEADRVNQLEDGGVGAGPKRQRHDRDDREGAVAAQQPRAVAQVLPQTFKAEGVHGVDLFADEGGVAEFAMRGGARPIRRHAARDVVGGLFVEVRGQLAGALVVPLAPPKEAAQAHAVTPTPAAGCD
jgi:hypothetical protein